jgi:hypothetical protein
MNRDFQVRRGRLDGGEQLQIIFKLLDWRHEHAQAPIARFLRRARCALERPAQRDRAFALFRLSRLPPSSPLLVRVRSAK